MRALDLRVPSIPNSVMDGTSPFSSLIQSLNISRVKIRVTYIRNFFVGKYRLYMRHVQIIFRQITLQSLNIFLHKQIPVNMHLT